VEERGQRTHVVHVVTGLGVGGAEFSLLRVVSAADRDRWRHSVLSLGADGPLAGPLRDAGAQVTELGLHAGLRALTALPDLARRLRALAPDVVQTWMYHADLLGGLAARMAGVRALAWGLHHSNLDPRYNKASTLRVVRACRALSGRVPAGIVCCSEATREVHAAFGYARGRMTVITNGYDTEQWAPDPAARREVRAELGIAPDAPVVGMVGRYHPLKDFGTFLAAAATLRAGLPDARFILCGDGVEPANAELAAAVAAAGLTGAVHLLGRRTDVARVMNAFDVAALSSRGEGFPNVVCEAMSCGIPCAVTDVGDAAAIVGDTGLVVPAGDARGLGEAWGALLAESAEERAERGRMARARVVERYSIGVVAGRYCGFWEELAGLTTRP